MKRAYSGSVSTFFNTKFLKQEKEKFIFEVTFPSETLNPFGFVQGGMITSALDEVTSITVNLISEDKKLPNSIDLHTSFHRPVKLGKVIIETKIIKIGKNVVSIEGKLFNSENKIAASILHSAILTDLVQKK
jgi:acyl-CoA thioesterase|tara:strand:+ start:354 stop:749 length:396 start_codon:yes stop_codon:yes gene_type:complete